MKKLYFYLFAWLTIPHIIAYYLCLNKNIINIDIRRWSQVTKIQPPLKKNTIPNLIWLLLFFKEFRNVFYLRIGKIKFLLSYLRPMSTLYIFMKSEDFGAGTFIQHGFSTIITAKHIGKNCWINQDVTIGYNNSNKYGFGQPWIGDNVRVSAGAKICGNISVGDNSTIGVNAVIIKNVPENSTVIPSPMILIKEKGISVNKRL